MAEHTPFTFENYVVPILPFLNTRYGKPTFYLIIGSFCFDPEDTQFAFCSGVALVGTGLLWALYYKQSPHSHPSDYRGFQHPQTDFNTIIKAK
mmetsp:Transcript_15882/g.11492  ORF Transcript_15882/g.11492 Transcript_15882/m.11492 type:complete len:93 (+) Transcript_15882:194-472(+)